MITNGFPEVLVSPVSVLKVLVVGSGCMEYSTDNSETVKISDLLKKHMKN